MGKSDDHRGDNAAVIADIEQALHSKGIVHERQVA